MAIALVASSATGASSGGSAVASIAPGAGIAVLAGDTIVVAAAIYGQTFRGTVADGTNTYTQRKAHTEVSGIAIFTAPVGSNGTYTPTYTCGGANAPLSIGVGAFRDMLDPAAPEANGHAGDISTGPATLGSALTLTDARLVLSAVVLGSAAARTLSTYGDGRLFAKENDGSGTAQMCFDYKILGGSGSENPSHTIGGGGAWWAIAAATFKPGAGGGGGSTILRQMMQHHRGRRASKPAWTRRDSGILARAA